MNVQFNVIGLTLEAECDYRPYRPARIWGPWENCYPEEPGEAVITRLTCGGTDAMFLLTSDYGDDITDAVYAACCDEQEMQLEAEEADAAELHALWEAA